MKSGQLTMGRALDIVADLARENIIDARDCVDRETEDARVEALEALAMFERLIGQLRDRNEIQ